VNNVWFCNYNKGEIMKSKFEEYTIEQRLEDLRSLTKISSSVGNYDANDYLHGMANGLILALATMENKYGADVGFLSKPSGDKALGFDDLKTEETKEIENG